MSAQNAVRLPFPQLAISPAALRTLVLAVLLGIATVVASWVSVFAFLALAIGVLGVVAYGAHRWPRTMLGVVVLLPIVDRFVIRLLLPPDVSQWARFLSEGVLGIVAAVISLAALRAGTFFPALRHPATLAAIAFVLVAGLSLAVNSVPPVQGAAGVVLTLEATVLFYLVRMVGFSDRQMLIAVGAFAAAILVTALLAIAQAVLSPTILGLSVVAGRFGEWVRVASFVGDPGLFGGLLGMASPFALFAASRVERRSLRRLALAAAFVLLLALLLSFSRGGWLGMIVGFGTIALLLDRRALAIALLLTVLAYGTSLVMPRDLLVQSGEAPGSPPDRDILRSTVERTATIGQGQDLRTLFVINALPIVRDHPVLGVGPGMYGGAAASIFGTPIYRAYETDVLFWDPLQRTVDNFWLHLVVEFGITGLLAFVALLVLATWPVLVRARRETGERFVLAAGVVASVAVLATNGVTSMLLEGNATAFPLWFLLGLGSLLVAARNPDRAGARDAVPATTGRPIRTGAARAASPPSAE